MKGNNKAFALKSWAKATPKNKKNFLSLLLPTTF